MDTLVVELNRSGPHSIDVAPAFHTEGSFEVVLDNQGAALHVYLHVDDDLADALTLSAVNHYVDEGSVRRVSVDVDESNVPARGRLKVVTGYGAETEFVTVTVEEGDEEQRGVEVDESLGAPRPRPPPQENRFELDAQSLAILGIGGVAVVVALLAALTVDGGLRLLAVLVALVVVGIGAVLLRG